MPAANYNASLRHQVLLERLKAGQAKDITPFLKNIDRDIRQRLSKSELTGYGRARLLVLLDGIGKMIDAELAAFSGQMMLDLKELAVSEALFEAKSIGRTVPDFESIVPARTQVLAAIASSPLSVRGAGGGKLLSSFVRDWSKSQKDTLVGIIRQGVFEGQTNAQIVKAVRGTAPAKFLDGSLAKTKRQTEALVRTAVQHVSSMAKMVFFEANSDLIKKYRWVSTLDNRTSEICQGLSGRVFEVGAGPWPPAHINCRSVVVAEMDPKWDFLNEGATQSAQFRPVDAKETYYSWLKKQNISFQNEAIGPTYAKLLNEGGLSADRFATLRLDKNFKPLNLAEMQKLEPLAFEQAGITLNPATGLPFSGR